MIMLISKLCFIQISVIFRCVLTLCMLGNFFMLILSSADIFQKYFFFQNNYFKNTIRASKGLDSDQDRHIVLSDLGPNPFLTVLADDKQRVKMTVLYFI